MYDKNTLASALSRAHFVAAHNNKNNISAVAALNAYQGSGSIPQAIAAGILSMGGQHAPLGEARSLIRRFRKHPRESFEMHIRGIILSKKKVPGFGHSYYKDQIDPAFDEVWQQYWSLIDDSENPVIQIQGIVNKTLEEIGKRRIFPNAAIITAAVCEYLDAYPGMEYGIAIASRIPAWVELINTGAAHWK